MTWKFYGHLIFYSLPLPLIILSQYFSFYFFIPSLDVLIFKFFNVFFCFRKYRFVECCSWRSLWIKHWFSDRWMISLRAIEVISRSFCAQTSTLYTMWIFNIRRDQIKIAFQLIFKYDWYFLSKLAENALKLFGSHH